MGSKHSNDYNSGKNGYVGGNPRYNRAEEKNVNYAQILLEEAAAQRQLQIELEEYRDYMDALYDFIGS